MQNKTCHSTVAPEDTFRDSRLLISTSGLFLFPCSALFLPFLASSSVFLGCSLRAKKKSQWASLPSSGALFPSYHSSSSSCSPASWLHQGTNRIGPVLKILTMIFLPLPLLLLSVLGILGSLLVGMGYGVFAALMATLEAVGEGVTDKLNHCFLDGTASTIRGACMVVRDVTDFCFHSYFSFMDELVEKTGDDETPLDIRCTDDYWGGIVEKPLHVVENLKGWQRLCEDLVGREGPFLETVCVPLAGLAIILWPLAVIGAVIASFLSSYFLGLHAGLIAYQEASFRMGLAYMISAVALFDEYTNDLLYLREGSCFPGPKYRKADILKYGTGQNKDEYSIADESPERLHYVHRKPRRALQRSKDIHGNYPTTKTHSNMGLALPILRAKCKDITEQRTD